MDTIAQILVGISELKQKLSNKRKELRDERARRAKRYREFSTEDCSSKRKGRKTLPVEEVKLYSRIKKYRHSSVPKKSQKREVKLVIKSGTPERMGEKIKNRLKSKSIFSTDSENSDDDGDNSIQNARFYAYFGLNTSGNKSTDSVPINIVEGFRF